MYWTTGTLYRHRLGDAGGAVFFSFFGLPIRGPVSQSGVGECILNPERSWSYCRELIERGFWWGVECVVFLRFTTSAGSGECKVGVGGSGREYGTL
jgi:hypothetical protein